MRFRPIQAVLTSAVLAALPAIVASGPFVPGSAFEPLLAVCLANPADAHCDQDAEIQGWASSVASYLPGSEVSSTFQTPHLALGAASVGDALDIVSLGRGGSITLSFDVPIADGDGADFAVFENGFEVAGGTLFTELAWVEVSSNGTDFVRFNNASITPLGLGAFDTLDPTNFTGLAGKYALGQGTAFDLFALAGAPNLDIMRVTHVRIVDIVGDGSALDTPGNPIFDPFPTEDSAGFDLDAIAVLNQANVVPPEEPVDVPLGPLPTLMIPVVIGTAATRLRAHKKTVLTRRKP